jgi:hypothetical protein
VSAPRTRTNDVVRLKGVELENAPGIPAAIDNPLGGSGTWAGALRVDCALDPALQEWTLQSGARSVVRKPESRKIARPIALSATSSIAQNCAIRRRIACRSASMVRDVEDYFLRSIDVDRDLRARNYRVSARQPA